MKWLRVKISMGKFFLGLLLAGVSSFFLFPCHKIHLGYFKYSSEISFNLEAGYTVSDKYVDMQNFLNSLKLSSDGVMNIYFNYSACGGKIDIYSIRELDDFETDEIFKLIENNYVKRMIIKEEEKKE